MLHRDLIVARSMDLEFAELDGEYLAVAVEPGYCYSFNALGMRIWRSLENSPTIGGVVSQLLEEYVIDERTCLREVQDFLERLLADGLVRSR